MNTLPQNIFNNFVRVTALFAAIAMTANSAMAFQVPDASEMESKYLDVLRSDAPEQEKALACKNLAIYGSDASVAELAKLLPNPRLSSWSRIALEAIPGDAPNEALRNAADTLDGRLLIGVINSLGVRRDVTAVDALITKLKDEDVEVASAAAVALGNIGNAAATSSLTKAMDGAPDQLRSAIAEGSILCAERLHNNGDSAAAAAIYEQIRNADVPMQRIIEATRGAILSQSQDGIPLLIETLRSTDKKMFQLALGTAREFPGGKVDKALAAELSATTPDRAALLIQALADRPNTVDLPVVLKAAEQGDKQVRLSAIDALQRIGNGTCLSALLKTATVADKDLASAARQTLAVLPGEGVNAEIGKRLANASGDQYRVLLQLVGERRIDAIKDVEKALGSSDASVRSAALIALGETVSIEQLPILVSQVVKPRHAEDESIARRALKAASVRMPDREACAKKLSNALNSSPASAKTALLEIITDVGGKNALQTLAKSAKSADPQLQDSASRLLGTWNSVEAAPVLLDLAKTGPAEKYRVRALRGYLGLARKFAMPDAKRAEMCQNAFDTTKRTSEHKLALGVLKIHPSAAGLKIAIEAMNDPKLKSDATATAMTIAQKIGGKGADITKLFAGTGLDKVKLEIEKAEYGAGTKQKDVTGVLRNKANGLPLIALTADYNSSFGGDPAPGVAKLLTVQYRMNGKRSKASFKESELILLPMPK